MSRRDLDGWAKALGAATDADAVAELRRWCRALESAQVLILPVYLRSIAAPENDPYDPKRRLDCALADCYSIAAHLEDLIALFHRHERGND